MRFGTSLLKRFDKKVILLISAFYTIITAGSLLKLFFLRVAVFGVQDNDWFVIIFYYFFLDWIIVVLFMILVSPFIKRTVYGTSNWYKLIFTHIGISLILGVFVVLARGIVHYLLGFKVLNEIFSLDSLVEYVNILDLSVLGYLTIVASIYIYHFIVRSKEDSLREGKLTAQFNDIKLKMLQSQLQPHFFFNSLNSIATLIEFEPKKAQETMVDLANCMREILNLGKRQLINLSEDAEILESYINLLRVRFADYLYITFKIDSEALNYQIPPLLIQPLVENTVKHGFRPDGQTLTVEVRIEYSSKMLILSVKNNGNPFPEESFIESGQNIGLNNINQRLNTLYPNAHTFIIQNLPNDSGMNCRIEIPATKAAKESANRFF